MSCTLYRSRPLLSITPLKSGCFYMRVCLQAERNNSIIGNPWPNGPLKRGLCDDEMPSAQPDTKPDIARRPHARTTRLNLRRGWCHSDQYSSCACVCTSARPHAKLHIVSKPHAGGAIVQTLMGLCIIIQWQTSRSCIYHKPREARYGIELHTRAIGINLMSGLYVMLNLMRDSTTSECLYTLAEPF